MTKNLIEIEFENNNDDLRTNLGKIQILNKELEFIYQDLEVLINKKSTEYSVASGINRFNLFEDELQMRINMNIKTFMFILRQAISKYFRALYQSREILGFLKVESPIPDLSVDSGIKKKLFGLFENKYQYDIEILDEILTGSDILILSRVIRNSIKKYAVLNAYSVLENGNFIINIICPVDNEIKDETLEYIKEKSIDLNSTDSFTIRIGFLENAKLYLGNLENVLIDKLYEKKYFDNY